MNDKIIAAKLLKIQEGISGAENNPEVQEKLNTFGYTYERINKGRTLPDCDFPQHSMVRERKRDEGLITGNGYFKRMAFITNPDISCGKSRIEINLIHICYV
jgi:hypothetical protein